MNSDEKVAVTLSIDPELLREIDARAKELDLNRSQYLRLLARRELATKPEVPPTQAAA